MGWYRSRGALITATACLLLTPLLLAVGRRLRDERLTRILAARHIEVLWESPDRKSSVFLKQLRNRPQAVVATSRIDRADLSYLHGLSGIRLLFLTEENRPEETLGQCCHDWPLETLILAKCRLSERDFNSIVDSRRLTSLQLSFCILQNPWRDQIARLKSLKTLGLRGTQIEDYDCPCFAHLTDIEYLELSHNPLGDAGVKKFSGCSKLKALYLQSTSCTPLALDVITGFHDLEVLRLNDMPLEPEHFDKLRRLPKLGKIVTGNKVVSDLYGPQLPPHIRLTFKYDVDE